jgi:hypothetical protein
VPYLICIVLYVLYSFVLPIFGIYFNATIFVINFYFAYVALPSKKKEADPPLGSFSGKSPKKRNKASGRDCTSISPVERNGPW